MEIVLGILLLFGAFTLGAVTSGDDDSNMSTAQIEIDAYGDHEQATAPLQKCQASGSAVTYRDLTVPYARPGDQNPAQTHDGESDGWDD